MSEFDFDDVFDKTHDEIPPVHDVAAGLWRFKVKAAKRFEPKDDGGKQIDYPRRGTDATRRSHYGGH